MHCCLQGFNTTKPSSTHTTSVSDTSKSTPKFDVKSTGFSTGNAAGPLNKANDNKAAHGTGMGLPTSFEDSVRYIPVELSQAFCYIFGIGYEISNAAPSLFAVARGKLCWYQVGTGGKNDASDFSFGTKTKGDSSLDSTKGISDSSSKRSGESSVHLLQFMRSQQITLGSS